MIKNINEKKYEKGQTLLFVVVAVTIALSVGIAVSTRTIGSLRRVTRTDTSTRVIAAAEGGIENMLGRSYSELNAAINPNELTDCESIGADDYIDSSSSCVYNFKTTGEDVVSSRAVVSVETYNSNEENGYSFDLTPGEVMEVVLFDGTNQYGQDNIQICWENQDTAVYYYSYDRDGNVKKGGLYADGFPYFSYLSGEPGQRFVEEDGEQSGFSNYCKVVSLVDTSYGLRIKVLYNDSKVAVFPTGGTTLPIQGYKLTSTGEIFIGEGSEEKATVIVHKSFPFASDIFDYGIYTPGILQ